MTSFKISHEVPLCLLDQSRDFNDYDYLLPHLMDEYEEYKNFFYKSKDMGRYIVMDNSLHELGEAYSTERLLYWINEIKPQEFLIPDVWEDFSQSVRNARQWAKIKLPKGVTKVAVVQAESAFEAMLCTKAYQDLGYKKIAYSYGASFYNDVCPHPNKNIGKAIGRFIFISSLYEQKILTKHDRVHLLGTSWPAEFGMYKNIECIESIDTSNPIMAGLQGERYTDMGLSQKPIYNMNSHFDIPLSMVNTDLIEYNVEMFREINNI
jgi:hypothetical protein